MKIFWLFNHPAPYKIDFFNELGKYADLDVFFERKKEGKRDSLFYLGKANNFKCHFCKGINLGQINNISSDPIRALKKNRYDIVVINGWYTKTERKTISYCKSKGIKYVFAINGGIIKDKESKIILRLKKTYISGAFLYLCPNERSADYLVYYGAERSLIKQYPYSTVFEKAILERPLSSKEKEEIKKQNGLQGKKVFISSGQFIDRKNNELLIKAWADRSHEESLYLIGSGPNEEKYKTLISSLRLENVFIKPFMAHDDLLLAFRGADAYLFSTREDIYGHVVNEAMSQGLPVISTRGANASQHLIRDGENGYLVDETEASFNKAIDMSNFEIMGKGAIETAKENTIEKMVAVHLHIFKELCE